MGVGPHLEMVTRKEKKKKEKKKRKRDSKYTKVLTSTCIYIVLTSRWTRRVMTG